MPCQRACSVGPEMQLLDGKGPQAVYHLSEQEGETWIQATTATTTYATLMQALPEHPNMTNCAWNWADWSYWPEGWNPREYRQGAREFLTWLSEKSSVGCFDARHFTGKSDLMEAARPHQCQCSCRGPSTPPMLYIKALAMTGPDGQMFAGVLTAQSKETPVWAWKLASRPARHPFF